MSKKAALITTVFSLTFAVSSLMLPLQAQEKNNLQNKFYTFDENQRIISAMGSPYMPLADKMKYGV